MGKSKGHKRKDTVENVADCFYKTAEKNSALIGNYLKKHRRG